MSEPTLRDDSTGVRWSSRFLFLLSAMGCTIGLGNIWRFPYVTGENGGGAFILIYALCLLCIATPAVIAELMIGHRGRAGAALAFRNVAVATGNNRRWDIAGHLMVLAGVIVLFYYPVVGSWSIEYFSRGIQGTLTEIDGGNAMEEFDLFMSSSYKMAAFFTLFHFAAVYAVYRGLREGIETAIKVTMPFFFLILCSLLVYTAFSSGISEGLRFLFAIDFSKVTAAMILAACGQALFTTAVGQASLLAYAAYVDEGVSLARYGVFIVLADTAVAILAGILIFSIVFAVNLEPAAGSGLAYITLPVAFSTLPAGNLIGSLFFGLLTLAAFTSTIPSVEVVARWTVDKFAFTHARSAVLVGVLSWLVGMAVLFSLAPPQENIVSGLSQLLFGESLLDAFDYLVSSFLLPVSVVALSLFTAWVLGPKYLGESLGFDSDAFLLQALRWMLRIVVPGVVIVILLANLTS